MGVRIAADLRQLLWSRFF